MLKLRKGLVTPFLRRMMSKIPMTPCEAREKFALSPHERYITQGKHMEVPFTGYLWDNKELGDYFCLVCQAHLFTLSKQLSPEIPQQLGVRILLGLRRRRRHL